MPTPPAKTAPAAVGDEAVVVLVTDRTPEIVWFAVNVLATASIATVSVVVFGKIIPFPVFAVVPNVRICATFCILSVSVLPAVRAVDEVAAMVTSKSALVSRIPNPVKPV